ncbi:MAG: PSD1 and planctomycete cytochrome C domain-containing protein [Planctomycetota bacterium]|nr:PSD1 and planctomycete cytochrome C domain-containing protein [Planctomycetota bacterium]
MLPASRLCLCLLCVLSLAVAGEMPCSADDSESFSKGEVLFALRVKPLLQQKCFACHGGDSKKIEAALDLTSRAGMLKGGEGYGAALVPGKAVESRLYESVTRENDDLQMPPKENDRLTDRQTKAVRDWIDAGAPWPKDDRVAAIVASKADGVSVATSGGLSEDWTNRRYKSEDLWAWQPIRDPELPRSDGPTDGGGPGHQIDDFIEQKLRSADTGLAVAPRADRTSLIRRATYDLIGLPPTPHEVRAFAEDTLPDREAFARVIDRLLASPHYGEQWGRHWLDVVRYADSAGFANDFERPNTWRYRDYVVRSFNNDKPYDQFVKEQLAGDEIDPENPEMLIAVGFLRMGPWEQTGMSVARVTRQQFLDDVTDAVGQVFLSNPLQCCRCHDHKFDPIPTRDYYRIQACFATTQFADRDAAFLDTENKAGFGLERDRLTERNDRYGKILKAISAATRDAELAWFKERDLPYRTRAEAIQKKAPAEQTPPSRLGLTPRDNGIERIGRKYRGRHLWELSRYEPVAFSVYSGSTPVLGNVDSPIAMPKDRMKSGELEETAILAGGDTFSPTLAVTPGVLSAVPDSNDSLEATSWNSIAKQPAGRRTGLANWIADKNNPLTVRSIVNRVWQGHFGRGLVATSNNFGATGRKPTHPELLDWLCVRFVEGGWSIKTLHRHIITTDAYARASTHPDMKRVREKDPNLELLAVFRTRRLAAEEIRDAMLAASGELNRDIGGIPIRPDMNLEAALQPRQIMGTYSPAYQPSPLPEQRNRRTIYALKLRGQRDPFLETFNQPGSDKSCERRETSTVTPQVFAMLNGEEVNDRALAMAKRLISEEQREDRRIDVAFRLCFGRSPTKEETALCLKHWREMTARHRTLKFERQDPPGTVTRSAVDELTGEQFEFTEKLEVYDSYIPDLKPWDVDAETRGLAEVCHVLLNSNEFLTVP